RGPFPFNEASWGESRIELTPDSGTNTFGRSGFFIHGGDMPGSAGCIDLLAEESDFMDYIRGVGQPVTLTVEYDANYTSASHPYINAQNGSAYNYAMMGTHIVENAISRLGAAAKPFATA